MTVEEIGYALNNAWRIDATRASESTLQWTKLRQNGSQLALEVLHDVQKLVVHVWPLRELHLDLVEITEGVADVEWPLRTCKMGRNLSTAATRTAAYNAPPAPE